MKTIKERFQHESIALSAAEKFVLTKLVAAETEQNAYQEVTRGNNVVAASDKLTKLGLMTMSENIAAITEQGQEALRKEALVDEMGELTEEGQMYGFASTPEEAAKADHAQKGKPEAPVQSSPQADPMGGAAPTDSTGVASQQAGEPDAFSIESIEMLRGFQEVLKEFNFLKKTKL